MMEPTGSIEFLCLSCGHGNIFTESNEIVLSVHIDSLAKRPYIYEQGFCNACSHHAVVCTLTDLR